MENSDSSSRVIGALLVGALTGAAVGLLFAPHKGSKTRRKLMNGAMDMADDVKMKLKEEASALRQKAEILEGAAMDKLHEVSTLVKSKMDGVKHTV